MTEIQTAAQHWEAEALRIGNELMDARRDLAEAVRLRDRYQEQYETAAEEVMPLREMKQQLAKAMNDAVIGGCGCKVCAHIRGLVKEAKR